MPIIINYTHCPICDMELTEERINLIDKTIIYLICKYCGIIGIRRKKVT